MKEDFGAVVSRITTKEEMFQGIRKLILALSGDKDCKLTQERRFQCIYDLTHFANELEEKLNN